MFGGGSQPAPPAPVLPPAPPNPPMFGERMRQQKPQQKGSTQFDASVLGSLPMPFGQRSLLGGMKTTLGG